MRIYRIFPTIGVARVGNSDQDYFIGPEAPGLSQAGPFRDHQGKIKRQAARFRIFEFERDNAGQEHCRREVVADQSTTITWTVHLANSKAARGRFPPGDANGAPVNAGYDKAGLQIDGGAQSIIGQSAQGTDISASIDFIRQGRVEASETVKLGELHTDEQGRLLVLGGHGHSASPIGASLTQFANNRGWYDDVSDGPVNAQIQIDGGAIIDVEPAWALVAPPAYAPDIDNLMTWYDQCVNINANFFNPLAALRIPSFTQDIYPILKRTALLAWVSSPARSGHGEGRAGDFLSNAKLDVLSKSHEASKAERMAVFNRLTEPGTASPSPERIAAAPKNMPMLRSGLDPQDLNKYVFPALTDYQYNVMSQWAQGEFDADWQGDAEAKAFTDLDLQDRPHALTRAALEACIGGPFFPGIEATYLIAQAQTYEAPFCIDRSLPAGSLTQPMAVPWQADFLACGMFWWPAQRPVSVKTESGDFANFSRGLNSFMDMVEQWADLGFVVKDGNEYLEKESKL